MEAPKNNVYVGRSVNLYTGARSYFLPSVLKRKDQRVICFFNHYEFNGVLLHKLRLHQPTTIETVIDLGQAVCELNY